jgi:hypothetical protein
MGIHWDSTITLGNIITFFGALALAVAAWRDMNWRVSNLETWRKEHTIDAESRDDIIKKMDKILYHLTAPRTKFRRDDE